MEDACIVRVCNYSGYPIIFLLDAEVNRGRVMSWMPVGQHSEASIEIMRQPHTRPATGSETFTAAAMYEDCYECELKVQKRVSRARLVKNWI